MTLNCIVLNLLNGLKFRKIKNFENFWKLKKNWKIKKQILKIFEN